MGTDAELKLDWMQQTLISLVRVSANLCFLRKPDQALSQTDGSPLNNAMHVTLTPTLGCMHCVDCSGDTQTLTLAQTKP